LGYLHVITILPSLGSAILVQCWSEYPHEPKSQNMLPRKDNSQALKANRIFTAGILSCFWSVTPSFLPNVTFAAFGMAYNLCLPCHCILETDNVFSSFVRQQREKILSLQRLYPQAPRPYGDDEKC
jgi:hypothetical protein